MQVLEKKCATRQRSIIYAYEDLRWVETSSYISTRGCAKGKVRKVTEYTCRDMSGASDEVKAGLAKCTNEGDTETDWGYCE